MTGFGAGAAGSRSGSMTAGAVRETASVLRDRIVAIAAHKLEAAAEDIELANSRANVRGAPSVGISLAEIAALAYFDPYSLPPGVPAGLEASARYTTHSGSIAPIWPCTAARITKRPDKRLTGHLSRRWRSTRDRSMRRSA